MSKAYTPCEIEFLSDEEVLKELGAYLDDEEQVPLLPIKSLKDSMLNPPPPKSALIEGLLNCSGKMLISGVSKSMKSFLAISLLICIAYGQDFLNRKCKQGKVLFINTEIDEASCINRFGDVLKSLGLDEENADNISLCHLRGQIENMSTLTTKIISTIKDKGYIAILIDPAYKLFDGNKNDSHVARAFAKN